MHEWSTLLDHRATALLPCATTAFEAILAALLSTAVSAAWGSCRPKLQATPVYKELCSGRAGPFHSDLLLNDKIKEPSSSADCTSGP